MLLFIAIIATLNLCLGYALGVYIGEFPGLPQRGPIDPPAPALDLNAPGRRRRKPKAKKPPKAEPKADEEPTEESAAPSKEPAAASTETEEANSEKTEATTEEPAKPKPSPQQVMDGMAAFQAQLAQMGAEMQTSINDEEAFGKHAGDLQQANHDYLEQAQSTIEELDADPSDKLSADCRDVIAENAKRVEETSNEIDSLLADGVPDEAGRAELVEKTNQLESIVESAEDQIEARVEADAETETAEPAVDEAEQPKSDEEAATGDTPNQQPDIDSLMSGLATLDMAEKAISAVLDEGDEDLVIATLRRDPFEAPDGEDASEIESRLLAGLADLVGETIEGSQLVAPQDDERLLVVLAGDTVEDAAQRVEQLRQQVEKTTFKAGKATVKTTVTCALAESTDGISKDELIENLDEALNESTQHGHNRCYSHDGVFPGPMAAEELSVKPRTVNI